MRHKSLIFVGTGILALWMGGCSNDSGSNTASPSPSPSASPGASSPSPNAPKSGMGSASPAPQTFPSPLVAAPPGLIGATNPEDRTKQVQNSIDAQKKLKGSPLTTLPNQRPTSQGLLNDPFALLPPLPLQQKDDGNSLPKLEARKVPTLPEPIVSLPRTWKTIPPIPPALPSENKPTGVPSLPDPTLPSRPKAWTPGENAPVLPGPTNTGSIPSLPAPNFNEPPRPWTPPVIPRQVPKQPSTGTKPRASCPSGATGSQPLTCPKTPVLPKTTSGKPSTTTPGKPSITTPGKPSITTPGKPSITTPGKPSITTPGKPSITTPGKPPITTPGKPSITTPGKPSITTPGKPSIPKPQPPSTALADGVQVLGVVQVGNEILVIVKAPDEATSRYVKVGQRIANAKVLVKRVEFQGSGDAVVILEENGVEVRKAVGELPPSSETAQNPNNK
jgi:hypothetical protein